MLCYFDSDTEVNLSHIPDIKNVRPLSSLKARLSNSNFTFVTTTEYSTPGIYLVEVSKIPILWCAKTFPGSFNLLLNLPSKVIKSAKEKVLRIVILSTIEGDNFTTNIFDGFLHLHSTVRLLGLPKFSVCIVSGNLNAARQYSNWCKNNNTEEYIEFLEGIEWDGKESNQIESPVLIEDYALPFNSLNRAHRNHRTEHLYFIAEKKLKGIVSGGAWFADGIEKPLYSEVNYDYYKLVLLENYPKTVDVLDLKNTVPNQVNNFEIYQKSQLTVVTESHYSQAGGLFITEKTFRPILLGHPFMILGQPGILDKLRTFGFETSFDGIDQSYDSLESDIERFLSFHQSLMRWCFTDSEIRRTSVYKWKNIVLHNFQLYKQLNFKKMMIDSIILSSDKYFIEASQNFL